MRIHGQFLWKLKATRDARSGLLILRKSARIWWECGRLVARECGSGLEDEAFVSFLEVPKFRDGGERRSLDGYLKRLLRSFNVKLPNGLHDLLQRGTAEAASQKFEAGAAQGVAG